jgi:hypothetical protein
MTPIVAYVVFLICIRASSIRGQQSLVFFSDVLKVRAQTQNLSLCNRDNEEGLPKKKFLFKSTDGHNSEGFFKNREGIPCSLS